MPIVGVVAGWRSPKRLWAVVGALGAVKVAWLLLLLSNLGPVGLRALAALCPATVGG